MAIQRKLAQILAAEPSLASLRERLERIAVLQRLCRKQLPPALGESVTVAEPVGDELRLFADSGAAAAKLRHHTPDLVAYLAREGWQFTGIRVGVQVRTIHPSEKKVSQKQIDAAGQASLARLATGLPDAPLKQAITRLLRAASGK